MRTPLLSSRSHPARLVASVAAAVLGLAPVVVIQGGAANAVGSPDAVASQSAPSAVLIGDDIPVRVTVGNPAASPGTPGYNALVRTVLPVGVSYVAGSTTPSDAGNPLVFANQPGAGQTTLVWKNVADIQPAGELTVGFDVRPSTTTLPVGSTVAISSAAYLHDDPRTVPTVGSSGTATAGTYTGWTTTVSTNTQISAIKVELREPSPEHELVRGVHDETTTYGVKVTNNDINATNAVTATVFVPAGLEFLGCGGVDNTDGTDVEYDGAPRLTVVPAPTGPGTCSTPVAVETVTNPAGLAAGVYTRVTWSVGNLAPGATTEIKYRAGVPLRSNTTTFPNGTPAVASGEQAANLDNNTGALTAESAAEQGLTTTANASGTYTGPFAVGAVNPQTAADSLTVTAEDLAVEKSGSTTSFEHGEIVDWTLVLRTGEYRGAEGITVVDTLPNGLCPLGASNYAAGAPADCDPEAGQEPSRPYTSVTELPSGGFAIAFSPDDLGQDDTVTITFPTRARTGYAGGSIGGQPTVGGDSFRNEVTVEGTSTPTTADPAPAVAVQDESFAELTSEGPSIDKQISLRPASGDVIDCATATYVDTPDEMSRPVYAQNDRVCFRLRVDFPSVTDTRNPVVTDFLPAGATYVPGSLALTAGNTVPSVDVDVDASTAGVVEIALGAESGSNRFVAKGAVFEALLAVDLTGATPALPADRIRGNLIKLRAINTEGQAYSLRDQVDYVQSGPVLGITKGVGGTAQAPTAPTLANAANVDNVTVRQDMNVLFRIDVTNSGPLPAERTRVTDTLPAGITCVDVSSISDSGSCSAGVITWQLPATDVIAGGTTRAPLTYVVNVPDLTAVSHNFVNTAAITAYDVRTDRNTTVPHTSTATDTSNVRLPGATVTKTRTTPLTYSGNTAAQASIGETIEYTTRTAIPAGTTVYDGRFTDTVPAGTPVAASPAPTATLNGAAIPGDWTFTHTATGFSLALPASYTNTPVDTTADVIEVVFTVTVADVVANARGNNISNTASFVSETAAGTPLTAVTANVTTRVVEPKVTTSKTNDADGPVSPGQTVRYTVGAQATGGTNYSAAQNVVVTDTLPVGVTYVPGSATGGGVFDGDDTITWNVATINPGAQNSFTYDAVVDDPMTGASTFTNTVNATITSLPGVVAGERTSGTDYASSTSNTLAVGVPPVTKAVDDPTRTVGEVATYTVTTTIPAGIELHDATLVDSLPNGLVPTGTRSITCTPVAECASGAFDGSQLTDRLELDGTSTIGWFLGDLTGEPVDRTITATYQARVTSFTTPFPIGNPTLGAGDTLTNTAQVYWNLTDGTDPTAIPADPDTAFDETNTPATAIVTVVEPDLTITKAVDDAELEPGDTTTYRLKVTNSAAATSSPAHHITVTDVLPAGIELVGSPSNGGTYDSATRTLTWQITGPIATGASVDRTFQVELTDSADVADDEVVTNTATIDTWENLATDPDDHGRSYGPADSNDSSVTARFPHVTVEKTTGAGAEQGTATIDSPFAWRIDAESDGEGTAYDTVITDELPADWTYVTGSAQVTGPGGTTTQVDPTVVGSELRWSVGTLAPGSTASVVFTATPGTGVLEGTGVGPANPHVNTAGATAEDATGATSNETGPYGGTEDTASALIDSTDLSVDKSHSGDFTAGTDGVYTLSVHNDGPSAATGQITVTDTLPDGLTYVSGTGTGWSCSAALQVVTCVSNADVADGSDMADITLTVAVGQDVRAGALVNEAAVTTTTYDPDLDNNEDTDSTDIVVSADLGVTKASPGEVVAGADVTWTIDVTNHGPSDSDGPIVVTDELPTGVSFVSAGGADADEWDCDVTDGTVTCTRDEGLEDDESAGTITLVGALAADATDDIVNTVSVDGPHPDPVSSNDEDEVTDSVDTEADLDVAKTHTGDFVPGETGTYAVAVTNHGPSVARGDIVVTDTLPTGLTYDSVSGAGWTCAAVGQAVTCTHEDDLDVDDPSSFDLVVDIASEVDGGFTNELAVESPTDDPDTSNNEDDDVTGIDVEADLGVEKSHPSGAVVAGENVTFTLDVTNDGPSDSAGPVVVTDTLPAGMAFVSAEGVVPADGWDCAHEDGVVICELSDGLDDGDASSISVVAHVASSVAAGTLTNGAAVDGPDNDPEPSNDSDTDEVEIITRADLELTKTHEGGDVRAGTSTTFTVAVENNGSSDAAAPIVVSDTLPVGTSFASAAGTGWDCSADGQDVTCTHEDDLAEGDSAPLLTLTVDVLSGTPAGQLVNTATVSSGTTDDVPANDTDDASFDVVTRADLNIAKSHPAGAHHAGDVVEWGIEVENAGPSDAAAEIVVVDTLPEGFSFVATADSEPWVCLAEGQVVTCELDEVLLDGATAPALTLLVLADASLDADTYTNTVEVSSGTTDPEPGDNTTTDDLVLTTSADLAVTKTLVGAAVIGDQATYMVQVENLGPSVAAADVVVTDLLPEGLTYVSATGTDWTCDAPGDDVRCTLAGDLAVGDAPVLTLTVEVGPKAYPSVTNTVSVDSSTDDPVTENDESSALAPVAPLVDLEVIKSHEGDFTVGEQGRYTLEVVNHGPTEDPGPIVLTDTLPAGLDFVAATGPGWSCAEASDVVTCTLAGGLAVDERAKVELDVDVVAAAAPGVVNSARVAGAEAEVRVDNNVDTDQTVVVPVADLVLTKELKGGAVDGGQATYLLQVENAGPSASVGEIVVTDPLPSGLGFVSAAGEDWDCGHRIELVTCTWDGTLAVGEHTPEITLVTAVTAAPGTAIENVASVHGPLGDPVTANDAASAAAEVAAPESEGVLADTGFALMGLFVLGMLAVLAGGFAVRVTRRRETELV